MDGDHPSNVVGCRRSVLPALRRRPRSGLVKRPGSVVERSVRGRWSATGSRGVRRAGGTEVPVGGGGGPAGGIGLAPIAGIGRPLALRNSTPSGSSALPLIPSRPGGGDGGAEDRWRSGSRCRSDRGLPSG